MAYITAPDFPIRAITLSLDRPGQTNMSAWTGKRTVVSNPWHGKWSAHVELATQQGEAAFQSLRSFFVRTKGTLNSFRIYATAGKQNNNGGVTLSANAAVGATSISISGATTGLTDGQYFTLNGQLCCLTTDQSGSLVTFQPPLRQAATSGTVVVTSRPYLLAYMSDSKFSYDIGVWRRFGIAFDVEEAVLEADGVVPETGDTTAPTLSSPTASSTGTTTATIGVTTNEGNGTLYWVITSSSTTPTNAQVKAGQNASGSAAIQSGSQAVSATGAQSHGLTGLTAATTYYAHFAQEDAVLNLSVAVSSAAFTTAASSTYLPTVTSSPMVVMGARRAVSGYNGPLFRLSNGTTQSDFSAATGSDLPDYTAISTFAGGAALTVVKAYDQSGNGRDMTVTSTVGFDLTQLAAGCVPFQLPTSGYFSSPTAGSNIYDRRNFSYFEVCQHRSVATFQHQVMFDFFDGTNIIAGLYNTVGVVNSYNSTDTNIAFSPTLIPRSNPSAIGMTANASGQTFFCRESTATAAAASAGAGNIFRVGVFDGLGWTGTRATWVVALYPYLSNTDANTVLTALRTMQSVPTSFTSRIVFQGDSILEGADCTNNKELVRQMSLNGTPELFNIAVSGSTLEDHYSTRASAIEPFYTTAYGAGKCVLVLEGGINSIISLADSASALYTVMTNLVSAEKTVGFKVVVADLLPVKTGTLGWNSTMETTRTTYNSSVLGNAAAADQVVDVANTGTTMGALTAPSDTSLYFDGLHPTTLGYTNLAPEYAAKINLLI